MDNMASDGDAQSPSASCQRLEQYCGTTATVKVATTAVKIAATVVLTTLSSPSSGFVTLVYLGEECDRRCCIDGAGVCIMY